MVPSTPGCAPPPPAARSSSRPTASCRATSSCTRTCCVTDLLRLVRINNLLLAAAGVLAGGWIALGAVRTPNVLALAAVAAVGVAMAGNVLNDIWDQAADRVNRSGGERPLATGRVTRGTADLCVAGGAVIGLGAAAFVNGTAVLVGLAAFAVLGLYSPVLKRRGVPRVTRPVARGRSPPDRLTRSAAWSQMSLSTLPAIATPTAATAASARTLGVRTAPSAIQPPARTPAAASSKLLMRTRRSRSVTQHVLVQLLVARHDAVGRELERAAGGGGAHPGVEGTIAQHAKAVRDHGRDVPLGREESRLPGHDHLGEAAHGGRDDRDGACHRLERGEAGRFCLRRQQEQVAASQDLGDVVHLAEEADVAS